MATGIETRIMEALNARLNALVFSPALLVAWDELAKGFVPPNEGYLVPHLLPATTEAFAISSSGTNTYHGIYQVDVVWPEGLHMVAPMETASAVAVHFKRGTLMTRQGITVKIERPPYMSQSFKPDVGWVRIPVNITYTSFVLNP